MKTKYSIFNENMYNFDEIGFIINIIIFIIIIITLNSCNKVK